MIGAFLILIGVGLGFWLAEREARQKRRGWRYYTGPSTNPLRDYK